MTVFSGGEMVQRDIFAVIILIACSLFSGCLMRSLPFQPLSGTEGLLSVYLDPLQQDAEGLVFEITRVAAVSEDGTHHPLVPAITGFPVQDRNRQRLLAFGNVPAGRYQGIACTVQKAVLKRGDGSAELLTAEAPATAAVTFDLAPRTAAMVSLNLVYPDSVRTGFAFDPVFSAMVPDRPLTGLTGYVANAGDGSLTLFDKKRMQVAGVLATGSRPVSIVLDQGRKRGYVADAGEDLVEVIDLAEGRIINKVRLNTGDVPGEPALTPDGGILIIPNGGADSVTFLDTRTLLELARIPVAQGPRSVLLDRTGQRAYVFSPTSNMISVIDVPYRSLAVSAAVEAEPVRGQFNRSGDRLYAICARSPYLLVLDPASLAVITRQFIGMGMTAIKVDTRTDTLYLAMQYDPVLGVYDPFSLSRGAGIPLGGTAAALAIDGDENNLYAVVPERRVVSVVNLVSRKIIGEFDVGSGPLWVAMMGER